MGRPSSKTVNPENQVKALNEVEEKALSESTGTTSDKKVETVEKKENSKTDKNVINFDSNKKYEIISADRANGKYYGCTGDLIEFNEKGVAVVCESEAKHFSNLPDCKIMEHKGE